MALLLGVDIGTTGLKAALLDGHGKVLAEAAREHATSHPFSGWAEQDPEMWWKALRSTVREIISKAGIDGRPLTGISISSMAPVVIALDASGRPLLPGMIWADKRAEAESEWLRTTIGEARINQITANHINSFYAAPKCLWLKHNRPDIFARTQKFVMANGYINFRLTGRLTIDHSHLPLLLLSEAKNLTWSKELFEAMDLPCVKFPEIRSCLDVIGEVTKEAAAELGISAGTPVLAGTVDTVAALIGMGIIASGQAFVSMGTGSNVGTCLASPAFAQPLVFLPHAVPGLWLATGVMTSTGASLKWFRNTFCKDEQEEARQDGTDVYDKLTNLAAQAPTGCTGVIFLPYLMGEQSPIWDDDARGVFMGLAPTTSRGDLVRAVMEGCAFGIRQNFEVFRRAGWEVGEVRIQGGAAKNALWIQIISDVVGRSVLVPPVSASAPVGNAILVGIATGVFRDAATACSTCVEPRGIYHPNQRTSALYDQLYPIYVDVYKQLRGSFRALATFRRQISQGGTQPR
jgi:xylulokinase